MGICVWQASLRSYWLTQLVSLVLANVWSSSGISGSCPKKPLLQPLGPGGWRQHTYKPMRGQRAGVQVEGFTVWEFFWLQTRRGCLRLGSINRSWHGLAWAEETASVSACPSYTEGQHVELFILSMECFQATVLRDREVPGCCPTHLFPLGLPVLHTRLGPQLSLIFKIFN